MKPRKPIKRTALKPPTREQIARWQSKPRKAIGRSTKAIARVGRKAKRERSDLDRFRIALRRRADGLCEAHWVNRPGTDLPICGRVWPHEGWHPHHIWPEDRDRGVHNPERGAWLCARAHEWCHLNPADAAVVGLLRPEASRDATQGVVSEPYEH